MLVLWFMANEVYFFSPNALVGRLFEKHKPIITVRISRKWEIGIRRSQLVDPSPTRTNWPEYTDIIHKSKITTSKFIRFFNDRANSIHGGTAIYVKNNITPFPVNNLDFNILESNGIFLTSSSKNHVILCSVYINNHSFLPIRDLELILNHCSTNIIAGDHGTLLGTVL